MRTSSASWRRATVVLTTVATLVVSLLATSLVAVSVLAAAPAEAVRVTPGSFTGYGFDACIAPTQSDMDTWLTTSPY